MTIERVAGDVWDLCFQIEDLPSGIDLSLYTIQYGLKKKPNDNTLLNNFPITGKLDTSEPGITKLLATVPRSVSETISKGNYWEAFLLTLESSGAIVDRKTLGERMIKVYPRFFT